MRSKERSERQETSTIMNVLSVDFTGKRALVTGAGAGIGRATALRLVELGAEVYALSKTQSKLDSLREENPSIKAICVDLADWEATRKAVMEVTPIHLLVNNAARIEFGPILTVSMEEVDKTMDINVKGVLNVVQVVASDLISRGQKGNIVNVSSTLGHKPAAQTATYAASKAAVESLTKSMALELSSKGIRVNALSPTLVMDTSSGEMYFGQQKDVECSETSLLMARTPQGKLPYRNDIVNGVVYLLSDCSDFVNGHSLPVDGGYLCC
ncbi:L-xylulose reductase isoform X2 [Hyalella azteca]|uniref:L-xylulose reductase isoform X2 n=1 Tax=Hyalella azteca TaxID=294128 RepID=A0A8B7N5X4_HYAAZ|nr:L-xylulose reductase isoform X2 [Hyalella azteca]